MEDNMEADRPGSWRGDSERTGREEEVLYSWDEL